MIEVRPPFLFTRESKIRIDRDGHVWHAGDRVTHEGLERALLTWVDVDDAGRYVMRNRFDWCFVTVDHTPLVVRSVIFEDGPSGRVDALLSDGSTEVLDVSSVQVDPDGRVYASVRGGRLLASFDRQAAFKFLECVDADARGAMTFRRGATATKLRQLEAGQTLLPPLPVPSAVEPAK